MKTLMLSLSLVSSAAIAQSSPQGSGNFRRAEAVKLVHANPKESRVIGLGTVATHDKGLQSPPASRVLLVDKGSGVVAVNAPLDRTQPVTKMNAAQMNAVGLLSQAQARAKAKQGGGAYRGNGNVSLEDYGLDRRGRGYVFVQKAPLGFASTSAGKPVTIDEVTRTVSLSGKGETASASVTPR